VSEEPLSITYVPPLAMQLRLAEDAKGRWLTEAEVYEVRDGGTCIALPTSEARAFVAARGGDDINPEDCWVEWQRIRQDSPGD
jgi:hypothetical protein